MKRILRLLFYFCCLLFFSTSGHAKGRAAAGPLTGKSIYQTQAAWTDDHGRPFKLTSLRGHPAVLVLFFTRCKVSCPMVIEQLKALRGALPEAMRKETRFVLVSMDAAGDSVKVLHAFREEKNLKGGGWILLRGDDAAVTELAMLLGMKIKKEAQGQFTHSNLVTVLNAEGEIAWQRAGLSGENGTVVAAIASATRPHSRQTNDAH